MKQHTQPQPYSQQNPPVYTPNDVLDLRELLKALWDGKLIIILVTALFTASAIGFALLAQEWWSSEAKITKPQLQEVASYQQQVKQFQPVFSIYQDDGTVLINSELDGLVDSSRIFRQFIELFNSINNKQAFLEQNHVFQEFKRSVFIGTSEVNDVATRVLYSKWFGRISASRPVKADISSPYVLTFQAATKHSSFDLLTSYIAFTESKVRENAFNNLQAVVKGKRYELIQQKKMLETQARNKVLIETELTNYALSIAEAAGVAKPIQVFNNNELFGIELGSKGLRAKIKALESLKNVSVIEPRLQLIDAQLDLLNNIEIDSTVGFQTFRYLKNVSQPTTRDKPKRALIVVLGTLLGGMLGVAIVLIRFAFRKED